MGNYPSTRVFFGGSAVKNPPVKAGDPSLIPGSGRSPGEGLGYPLQYSWASLVAQMVKNPPAMQETWIWYLGWKDPPEESMATHSSILAWRIPMDRGAWRTTVHEVTERHNWVTKYRAAQRLTLVLITHSITLNFLLASCKALPLDFWATHYLSNKFPVN